MCCYENLVRFINDNNLEEYKITLFNDKLELSFDQERSIILHCIEENKIDFFKEFIESKKESVFYFDVSVVTTNIIKKDLYNFIEILIKNIKFTYYINFSLMLSISEKLNNYNIVNHILQNDLLDLDKHFLNFNLIKIMEIKSYDTIKLLLNKLPYKISIFYDDNYLINEVIPIKFVCNCEDNIFELIMDYILEIFDEYLEVIQLRKGNLHLNIFKFDYIYSKLKDINKINYFIELILCESYVNNNCELFDYLINKFSYDNKKLYSFFQKNSIMGNNRNILNILFMKNNNDTSLLLYNKIKEVNNFDINKLINGCIDKNNNNILEKLDLNKCNVKSITNKILERIKTKYLDYNVIDIFLKKTNILSNKNCSKFINHYTKFLIEDNQKILLNNLITNIENLDTKIINNIHNKIKYYISEYNIKNRIFDGDIYDWYYIEWVDNKLPELNIINSNVSIIKNLIRINIPNSHFVYWYLNQNNKFLDADEVEDLLIRLHNNTLYITNLMMDNIDKDNILVKRIKNILKSGFNENQIKSEFIDRLFSIKTGLNRLIKIENYDDEMINLFKKHVYNNKYIMNSLKQLVKGNHSDFVIYILDKSNKIKLNSYKLIIDSIIVNKNYYLINKISLSTINLDKNKFYKKLLIESIKYYNLVVFEYSYKKLNELNNSDINIKDNIKIGLDKINFDDSIEIIYNFLIRLSSYVDIEIKIQIYKLIIHKYKNISKIIYNLLKIHVDFSSFDINEKFKFFQCLVYNINRVNIFECLNMINISNEDFEKFGNLEFDYDTINLSEKNIETLKYNLIYSHNIELIKYLNEKGLKLKFDNSILINLFECRFFNRGSNNSLNNKEIFNIIVDLSELDLFEINLETLNLFLMNYHRIKYKISLYDVKFLIEKYKIDIDYTSVYHSSRFETKDIFDYLRNISSINLKQNNEEIMMNVCLNDDVAFASYLLKIEPTFNLSIDNDNIFSQCCNEGSLDSIKWLHSMIPEMNEKTKYEYSICGAVFYNHLNVAKWLMENIENLDIKVDNDYCMVSAVENESFNIIEWILELEPERYNIKFNEDFDEIIEFTINKKLIIEKIKKIEKSNIIECPICYDNKSNVLTCCNHQFCYKCLNEYYKKNTKICCPICRKDKIELFNIE